MDALVQRIDSTVGSRIDKICHSSLGSDFNQNQCAHYVSHLMGYDLSNVGSWTGTSLLAGGVLVAVVIVLSKA